jgi:endoglucanase
VAVILGEYGVLRRERFAGAETYRVYWNQVVTRSAWQHGLVPVYWDNGVIGDKGMGLFDRRTGAQAYPALVKTLVDAAR